MPEVTEREEDDQGQPLRPQRRQVGELVGPDGGEREGGAGEERRPLRGAEAANVSSRATLKSSTASAVNGASGATSSAVPSTGSSMPSV